VIRCGRNPIEIARRVLLLAGCVLVSWSPGGLQAPAFGSHKSKIAVLTFKSLNLEASGYGSNITNLLTNALGASPLLYIMDRKELESFLALNELHQDDDLQNMVSIGSRLALDFVVAGRVTKTGPAIVIDCKVAKVDENRAVLNQRLKILGDSALRGEIESLAKAIQSHVRDAPQAKSSEPGAMARPVRGPTKIVARSGKSAISLYWEDPPEQKAAGYKLYRGLSKEGPYIKVAQPKDPQYTDTGLENRTTYYYRIKAYDERGTESDFSDIASAQTAPTPEPPIILAAEGRVKGIQVIWAPNPVKNPEAGGVKTYVLYRAREGENVPQKIAEVAQASGGGSEGAGGIQKHQYLDGGIEDGVTYVYKASAVDEGGLESDFSRSVSGATVSGVTGVKAEGNLIRENRLKWLPAPSPVVKGYHIYRSKKEDRDFVRIKTIEDRQANQYIDESGLEDDTPYFYRMALFDDAGRETSPSHPVSARTKGAPPPPLGLKAQSGLVKRVALAWEVNPQEEVVGYKLYRGQAETGSFDQIAVIGGRANTVYTDAGTLMKPLEDNKTYHYRVYTFNKVDVSSLSGPQASATTKPRPTKPGGLTAAGNQVKAVSLTWTANQGKDVVSYQVFRKDPGAREFSQIKELGPETSHVDKGLEDGAEYAYSIRALDKDGLLSDLSDAVTARTKPRPAAPEGLTASGRGAEVLLTWQPSKEKDIAGYHLLEKGFLGFKKVASVQETQYRVEGLGPGKTRIYAVTAVDRDGLESDPSPPVTVSGP
jgi:hypothetical protein